jgi:hypothetical protein
VSLLLLFRPKSGVGGPPEEPAAPIVVIPGGVKRRKKYIKLEDRETLADFLKGELRKQFPEELPDPLAEQRAAEDRKRLQAQAKREAEMRREAAAALEKKRKAVERHNRAVIALLMLALQEDDDS